jgi:hypothetical protein
MAAAVGLSVKQVEHWFANRRARAQLHLKKSPSAGAQGASPLEYNLVVYHLLHSCS